MTPKWVEAMTPPYWAVSGNDRTPDGYRDHLYYRGTSWWQALKAYRAARRAGMELIDVTRVACKGRVWSLSRVQL